MLTIRRDAYDEIVHHGYAGGDEEVCGVLAGEHGADASRVTDVSRVENVADAPQIRYAMDPEAQLQRIDEIESRGLDVVGFYHTHPTGPARPSAVDADRATWPGYSYVICAFDGHPYLGSWRWNGEEFEQETVAIAEE
ncbi:M67 family peptidase [Halobellus sp. Atlit-38R]|uniref:desampylase n=1 Tax=Halobellus sp. Atlit-38R TaxID=2282131 RepID=UPI000EF1A06E|nr:desampylase [Halobellus sp. Atlit-38R]RLM89254.1 M67 family peptidase [Halobellus sp. Atlit-38R]